MAQLVKNIKTGLKIFQITLVICGKNSQSLSSFILSIQWPPNKVKFKFYRVIGFLLVWWYRYLASYIDWMTFKSFTLFCLLWFCRPLSTFLFTARRIHAIDWVEWMNERNYTTALLLCHFLTLLLMPFLLLLPYINKIYILFIKWI